MNDKFGSHNVTLWPCMKILLLVSTLILPCTLATNETMAELEDDKNNTALAVSYTTESIEERTGDKWQLYAGREKQLKLIVAVRNPDPCKDWRNDEALAKKACNAACPYGGSCNYDSLFSWAINCYCEGGLSIEDAWKKWLFHVLQIVIYPNRCTSMQVQDHDKCKADCMRFESSAGECVQGFHDDDPEWEDPDGGMGDMALQSVSYNCYCANAAAMEEPGKMAWLPLTTAAAKWGNPCDPNMRVNQEVKRKICACNCPFLGSYGECLREDKKSSGHHCFCVHTVKNPFRPSLHRGIGQYVPYLFERHSLNYDREKVYNDRNY